MECMYPKMIDDYYMNPLFTNRKGDGFWVVGSIEKSSHILVNSKKIKLYKYLFSYLDGTNTINNLVEVGFGTNEELNKVINTLKDKGLIEGYENSKSFNEAKVMSVNLFTFERKINSAFIQKVCSAFSRKYNFILLFLFISLIISYIVFKPSLYLNRLFNGDKVKVYNTTSTGILYILINACTIIMFILHEIGHVVCGLKYKKNDISVSTVLFLGFIPMIYIKHKNLYSLPKKNIIDVLLGGMLANLGLGTLFLTLYFITGIEFFEILALSNYKIIYINILPISLTDGYFIFGLLLNLPNTRLNMYRVLAKPLHVIKLNIKYIIISTSMILAMVILFYVEINWFLLSLNIHMSAILSVIITCAYMYFIHIISKIRISKTISA